MKEQLLIDQRLREQGIRVDYLINQLGVSRQAYYNKKKGRAPWRTAEMFVVTHILDLSEDDKHKIFYV